MTNQIYERLMDITPQQKISDMTIAEIEEAVNIAFKIIGYECARIKYLCTKVMENTKAEWLYEFIYEVFEEDSL